MKGGIGGTGDGAPDWGVGDGVRAKVEFQDVVGTFAVGLVSGPVFRLTFGAYEGKWDVETGSGPWLLTAVRLILAA